MSHGFPQPQSDVLPDVPMNIIGQVSSNPKAKARNSRAQTHKTVTLRLWRTPQVMHSTSPISRHSLLHAHEDHLKSRATTLPRRLKKPFHRKECRNDAKQCCGNPIFSRLLSLQPLVFGSRCAVNTWRYSARSSICCCVNGSSGGMENQFLILLILVVICIKNCNCSPDAVFFLQPFPIRLLIELTNPGADCGCSDSIGSN